MAVLKYLNVELKLMVDNFNNNLKASQKELKEFEKIIKPSVDLLKGLGEAATAAGTAIVGALALAVKGAADYGDEINDASKKTGVTTEELSKLRLAAETSGSSFEGLTTGLKFLAKNMELAITGGKEQQSAFKALGISTKDLVSANGDVNTILRKVSDSMAGAQDDAAKTAIAVQLFGKAGSELIPFLNEGSSGLKKWGDEAQRAGRVVSAEAAKAADEFNDRLRVLQVSVLGLGGSIGNALIPTLTEWVKEGTKVIQQVKDWTAENRRLGETLGAVGAILLGSGGVLLGIYALNKALPVLVGAFSALKFVLSDLSILTAVRSVGDLKAALILLGETSVVATAGLAGLVAGAIYFRKELAMGLVGALATILTGFEKFLAGVESVDRAIGATGLADTVHGARASLENFRKGLEDANAAAMEQSMTIGATSKQLEIEREARDKALASTAKHRLELAANTEELEKQRKAAQELAAFWNKALLEFKNQTFAGGDSVKEGLRVADDTAKKIIDAYKELIKLEQEAGDALQKNKNFWDAQLETIRIGSQSITDDVKAGEEAGRRAAAEIIRKHKEMIDEIARKNKQAVEDVKRSAGKIFDDMFIKGQNVFSGLKNALKGGALSIGRSIFEDVVGYLGGPIKKAFDDFFTGLLKSVGIQKFLEGIGSKLGGVLSGVFSGGKSVVNTASQIGGTSVEAAGGIANAAGAGSSAASAVGTAVGAGISGVVGAVGGVVSAISGIIGNFQMARMEGTLNAIEHNTRYASIDTEIIINSFLWPMKNSTDELYKISYYSQYVAERFDSIVTSLGQIYGSLTGKTTVSVSGAFDFSPFTAAVNIFDSASRSFADSVKAIAASMQPKAALAAAGTAEPSYSVNITGPLTEIYISKDSNGPNWRRITRDDISPELLAHWKSGNDDSLQKLLALIKSAFGGNVTSRT